MDEGIVIVESMMKDIEKDMGNGREIVEEKIM